MDPVFNTVIDTILIAGQRVLEIPLFVLAAILLVVLLTITLAIRLIKKRGGRRTGIAFLKFIRIGLAVCAITLMMDYKIIRLMREVRDLRARAGTDLTGLFDLMRISRGDSLIDLGGALERLRESFDRVKIMPIIYDEAVDIILLRLNDPEASIYLAVIDLKNPDLVISVDSEIMGKWMTSRFGEENNSLVAINGEAGIGPSQHSPFGKWIGNLICRGTAVRLEDTKTRPFLSFDRNNRPRYYPQNIVDRTVTPEKYNTIWGRVDILVEGKTPDLNFSSRWTRRHPRTAMAVNREGDRLYLLVADGRQPGFSMGLTAEETAIILRAFGASDGMACDGGGSSCIYLKKFGGIVNSPSDGSERPTYTHFGITTRES